MPAKPPKRGKTRGTGLVRLELLEDRLFLSAIPPPPGLLRSNGSLCDQAPAERFLHVDGAAIVAGLEPCPLAGHPDAVVSRRARSDLRHRGRVRTADRSAAALPGGRGGAGQTGRRSVGTAGRVCL